MKSVTLMILVTYASVSAQNASCEFHSGEVNSSTIHGAKKTNLHHEAIMSRIDELGDKIKSHEIFAQHESDAVPLVYRYNQVGRFMALAFTFQDLMRVLRDHYRQVLRLDGLSGLQGFDQFGEEKMDRLVRSLLHHVETDIGHAEFLIADYRKRFETNVLRLDTFGSVVYEEDSLYIRHYMYKFVSLALARLDDPVEMAYLLETGDHFAGHFFGCFAAWVNKYGLLIGHEFGYLGDKHLDKEHSHEDMFDILKDFEMNEDQFDRVEDLIRQHVANFGLFLEAKYRVAYKFEQDLLSFVSNPLELLSETVTRIY